MLSKGSQKSGLLYEATHFLNVCYQFGLVLFINNVQANTHTHKHSINFIKQQIVSVLFVPMSHNAFHITKALCLLVNLHRALDLMIVPRY